MRSRLAISAVLILVAQHASAQSASPAGAGPVEMKNTGTPGKAQATRSRTVTAVVTAVDLSSRTVTLRSPSGEVQTISAGPQVQRLNEVSVGDTIVVEYNEGLMLELQPAGVESVPLTTMTKSDRTGKDQPPVGVTAKGLQATVTVTAIDLATRMVAFQGPRGNTYNVKAGPNIRLEKLKVGDHLLATYIEAVAVKLEKAHKN